ncbi:MAG TPA: ferrochelatase [Candidatus Krumholzibacteria bacterium]|nr:ferrochelatase [Candidatus Krumholzibacteria bacterium]
MNEQPCPYPKDRLDPGRTTGLILTGMGGPDGPDAVRPFLLNLFGDPMIFPAPRPFGPLLGKFIATVRTPGVKKRYLAISPDGRTPQLDTTLAQARDLAGRLAARGLRTLPAMAMRYWRPFPAETVPQLVREGAEQFVVVPTYPQYSCATNGATLGFLLDGLKAHAPGRPVHVIPEWHLQGGFLAALAAPVIATLQRWRDEGVDPGEAALVYVAHSLPQKMIDGGDPYLVQTMETVDAVHTRVRAAVDAAWLDRVAGGTHPRLAFQSRVGPIKWLGPEITAETARLAGEGRRRLHVQPVSFTCEHIETLMELDIELREDAEKAGIHHYQRGAALNLDATWLASMADEIAARAFGAERAGHE